MALATLSIDLVASLAKFEADMGRATRIAEQASARMGSSFSRIGEVFVGSALAEGALELARGLTTALPSLVDSVALLQDLEEMSGASAVALAGLQTAADVAGLGIEGVAGLMVKLTGTLSKTSEESKGAGAALKAIGLDLEAFRALAPDQQFQALAQALAGFQDGAGKTAIAIALLGKSGAEALPFLKALGEVGADNSRLTADQIQLADSLADSQAKLSSELRQAAQVAALQMLPAFTTLGQELAKSVNAVTGVDDAVQRLRFNTALREFAQDAVVGLARVGEAIAGVVKFIQALGGSLGSVATDVRFAFDAVTTVTGTDSASAKLDKLKALLEARNQVARDANQRWIDLWNQDGTKLSTALSKSFATANQQLVIDRVQSDPRELARRGRPAGAQGGNGLPAINFVAPNTGATNRAARDAEKALREANRLREQALNAGLRELQDNFQRERDALSAQDRELRARYDAGLISLQQFYGQRGQLDQQGLDAQLDTYKRQADALRAYLQQTADPLKREQTQARIADIERDAARAREQFAAQAKLDTYEQAAGYAQLSTAVREYAAEVAQLSGREADAARIRADLAIERARVANVQSGGQIDLTGYAAALARANELADLQRQLATITERAGTAEERYLLTAAQSGATRVESDRAVYGIRQQGLQQMALVLARTEALASAAGPDSEAARFAQQLRLEFERLAAAVDPALERLRAAQADVGGALAKAGEELVLNFSSARDVIKGLEQDLLRLGTRQLVTQPLEDFFTKQLRQLTEGQGALAQVAGSLFGLSGGAAAPSGAGGVASAGAQAAGVAAQAAQATAAAAATTALATSAGAATAGLTSLTAPAVALTPALTAASTALAAITSAATSAAAALAVLPSSPPGAQQGSSALPSLPDLGSLFDVPFFHAGGIAGGSAMVRQLPAVVFANSPRYHTGGIGGLAADEVPAVLRRGEEVVPVTDRRHRFNGGRTGGGSTYHVNVSPTIVLQSGAVDRRTANQIGEETARHVQRALARNG